MLAIAESLCATAPHIDACGAGRRLAFEDGLVNGRYLAAPFEQVRAKCDVFFTSHFWPGLALFLANGVPNIAALALRRKSEAAWRRACLVAGVLLLCWTVTEMVFIPNGLSSFYLVLGILQTAAAVALVQRTAQA